MSPTWMVDEAEAPDAIERDLKEAGIRLLDLLEERVEHDVDQRREPEAIERAMERAVRVGHDDQLQPARAQRRERLRDAGRHELPEVVLLVVLVELGQRLGGRVRERHAGGRQHEVEVRPPALCVVRRLDRLAGVDLLLGVGLRRGQRLGRDVDAALPRGRPRCGPSSETRARRPRRGTLSRSRVLV